MFIVAILFWLFGQFQYSEFEKSENVLLEQEVWGLNLILDARWIRFGEMVDIGNPLVALNEILFSTVDDEDDPEEEDLCGEQMTRSAVTVACFCSGYTCTSTSSLVLNLSNSRSTISLYLLLESLNSFWRFSIFALFCANCLSFSSFDLSSFVTSLDFLSKGSQSKVRNEWEKKTEINITNH